MFSQNKYIWKTSKLEIRWLPNQTIFRVLKKNYIVNILLVTKNKNCDQRVNLTHIILK